MARSRPGLVSRWQRSPARELATWSWFWMKLTKEVGPTSHAGVPRPLPLPRVSLPLVEKPSLDGRDELLGGPGVVAEVRLGAPREGDRRGVVEVVVPQGVEVVAAGRHRADEPHVLRLVLGDEEHRSPAGARPRPARDRRQHVLRGIVVDVLRGVQPEPVQVKLVDPVAGVRDEELADRPGALAVEVDRRAPVRPVTGGEVSGSVLAQVVAVGAEVVVHHVEDDAHADGMSPVHEGAEVVGPPVEPCRGEEVDTVVAPAEVADEVGDRQHLHHRDARPRQLRQLAAGSVPVAGRRERPDVQLVHDLALSRDAGPPAVRPAEGGRVDDLGWAVGAVRLEAGRGVRVGGPAIEAVRIPGSRLDGRREPGVVPMGLGIEPDSPIAEIDLDLRGLRRPDAEVPASLRGELRSDRKAPPFRIRSSFPRHGCPGAQLPYQRITSQRA